MRLTIHNIERIKGAGSYNSPVVFSIDKTGDKYGMKMDWKGYLWNVVLNRRMGAGGYWNMTVQRHGKMDIQHTEMSREGLSTPQQFIYIVETLMSRTRH